MDIRSNTVDGVLRRSARRTPARTALVFGDRTWTYRELDEATTRTAAWLRTLGVAQGDRVAAYGRNSDRSEEHTSELQSLRRSRMPSSA